MIEYIVIVKNKKGQQILKSKKEEPVVFYMFIPGLGEVGFLSVDTPKEDVPYVWVFENCIYRYKKDIVPILKSYDQYAAATFLETLNWHICQFNGWELLPFEKQEECEEEQKKETTIFKRKPIEIEDCLSSVVRGQECAIKSTMPLIKRAYAGLNDPNRPLGVILLSGKSGTGKTLFAKALSASLFDDGKPNSSSVHSSENMYRIDCAELSNKGDVNRVIGCFAPDTPITLSDGNSKAIENINIGDEVLTHTGDTKPVINKFKYTSNDLIEIDIARHAENMIVTRNHEILAIKSDKTNKHTLIKSYGKNPEWIHAGDLEKDDIILFPIQNINRKSITFDMYDFTKDLPKYKKDDTHVWAYNIHRINRFIEYDEKLARLFGYYISEGGVCSKNKGIHFTFNGDRTDLIDATIDCVRSIWGDDVSYKITYNRNGYNAHRITFHNRAIALFMSAMCGRNTWVKKIPDGTIYLPKMTIYSLLNALINCDGCLTVARRIQYDTVSKQLFYGLTNILNSLGIITHSQLYAPEKINWKSRYRLYISGQQINEVAGLLSLDMDLSEMNTSIVRHANKTDNYIQYRIRNIKNSSYTGDVYDLSIEQNSSYVANGCAVHNSPAGYVGHDNGSPIAKFVSEHPAGCVILIDEAEKAEESVRNFFLGVFDRGEIKDHKGEIVDMRNCFFVLTTNLGTKEMEMEAKRNPIGFTGCEKESNLLSISQNAINKALPPEFRNRLDENIIFNELSEDSLREIVKIEVGILKNRLKKRNSTIRVYKKAEDLILKRANTNIYGGREIRRVIERDLATPISTDIADGKIGAFTISVKDDEFSFSVKEKS